MIIASQKKHAAASARVRFSVRVLLACYLLGGAFSCAMAGPQEQYAQAGRRDEAPREQQRDNRNEQRGQQRGGESRYVEQRQADPGRADPRQTDPRRAQPAADQGHPEGARRNSRMTPDERRDLRRQINEAGQDIYATPPRR